MRGKLRDKPTNAKQYRMRRELMERRRPAKRENRVAIVLNQQWEDDDDPLDVHPGRPQGSPLPYTKAEQPTVVE